MAAAEPTFVIVEWQDAWHTVDDFIKRDEAKEEHKPAIIQTLGWLLVDDERGVSLFTERDVEDGSFRGRTFIPRGMVLKVTPHRLTVPKKRKKKAEVAVAPEGPVLE